MFRQPSTLMNEMLEDEETSSPDLNISQLRSKTLKQKKSIRNPDGSLLPRQEQPYIPPQFQQLERPPQTSINEYDEDDVAEHFKDVERQLFDESDEDGNYSPSDPITYNDEEKGYYEEAKVLKTKGSAKKSPKPQTK